MDWDIYISSSKGGDYYLIIRSDDYISIIGDIESMIWIILLGDYISDNDIISLLNGDFWMMDSFLWIDIPLLSIKELIYISWDLRVNMNSLI